MTPDMIALMQDQEGFSAKPYYDTRGVMTVGYGTNLTQGITRLQADGLMCCEINANRDTLGTLPWFTALDVVRQSAIENMAYNLGIAGVLKFVLMIAALKGHDYDEASAEMLDSAWAEQVGQRAIFLAAVMKSGNMPNAD